MDLIVTSTSEQRNAIETDARAKSHLCWTCGTCDNECPVNLATSRLSPRKIVRLASFGLLDELLRMPEIWYCLTCQRCVEVCPNGVQPAEVIRFIREESLRRQIVKWDMLLDYEKLFGRFQRVRLHATIRSMNGKLDTVSDEQWYGWLDAPVEPPGTEITPRTSSERKVYFRQVTGTNITLCLTCSECTNCCPVFYERSVFDPQATIRMVNLGLTEELLLSPSIWLCIGCGRCSNACTQTVKGREIIARLRRMAIDGGWVNSRLPYRLKDAEKLIYPRLLDEIDACLGVSSGRTLSSDIG
ncbi:MAG: 4Fe-4S dicluster domain-containing protein [Deltaproteobacteria bacterium]|nr:MAG: 4Fe-4S dicluster domain-containing protein [Deltaproteobacteria bacterium]